jgi:hypothetical protein
MIHGGRDDVGQPPKMEWLSEDREDKPSRAMI